MLAEKGTDIWLIKLETKECMFCRKRLAKNLPLGILDGNES